MRQQLSNDQINLQENQPPPTETEQQINNLAIAGTLGALGAVGTGLYFAAPLLMLGGNNHHYNKYDKSIHKKNKKTIKKR